MSRRTTAIMGMAACILMPNMFTPAGHAEARAYHRHVRKSHTAASAPGGDVPMRRSPSREIPRQEGVAGYFGPPPFYHYGYGPYWGVARGDLGFALLGAMNGGGFRGFVECGNYYARYPGACGF